MYEEIIKWIENSTFNCCIGMVYQEDKEDFKKAIEDKGWSVVFTHFGLVGNPIIQFEVTKK